MPAQTIESTTVNMAKLHKKRTSFAKPAPLSTWAAIVLDIERMTPEGRGLSHYQDKPVFVEGALAGEQVQVRLSAEHSRFAEAVTEKVLQPVELRRQPPCEYYGRCGGCSVQHMQYGLQLEIKQQAVAEQLSKLAGLKPQEWLPTLTAGEWRYRTRTHLAMLWDKQSKVLRLGFRARKDHEVVEVGHCQVLDPRLSELLPALKALMLQYPHKGRLGHIELVAGDEHRALMLRLTAKADAAWLSELTTWCEAQQLQLWLQEGEQTQPSCHWPAPEQGGLYYTLPAFASRFDFTPADFIQVNPALNRLMVEQAMALLAVKPGERVLDLFAGLGNFSLAAARAGAEVIAVEGTKAMVERGNANAQRNGLSAVQFHCADLMADFSHQSWAGRSVDKVILDPPRAGALHAVRHVAGLKPSKIVYISCNPATLARDAAELDQLGYRLIKAGAMDMFPQTSHVEAIALFEPYKRGGQGKKAAAGSALARRYSGRG